MMARRWAPCAPFQLDGLWFRVQQGNRHPLDLRLDYRLPGGWRPVHMRLGGLLADFFGENEDVTHPDPQLGGLKYLLYLDKAWASGWQVAEAQLRQEARRHGR